jgi:hypothetical protein
MSDNAHVILEQGYFSEWESTLFILGSGNTHYVN